MHVFLYIFCILKYDLTGKWDFITSTALPTPHTIQRYTRDSVV